MKIIVIFIKIKILIKNENMSDTNINPILVSFILQTSLGFEALQATAVTS
jgi:hypothetical protein